MKKLQLISVFIFLFILLLIFLINTYDPDTCLKTAERYKKVSFNLKIETMTGQKYIKLTGKNVQGGYVEWQDTDRWISDSSDRIFIGDSIKKDSGSLILTTVNHDKNSHHEIIFMCNDKIYH